MLNTYLEQLKNACNTLSYDQNATGDVIYKYKLLSMKLLYKTNILKIFILALQHFLYPTILY